MITIVDACTVGVALGSSSRADCKRVGGGRADTIDDECVVGTVPDVRWFTIKEDIDPVRSIEGERVEIASERIGIFPVTDRPMGAPLDDLVASINGCAVGRALFECVADSERVRGWSTRSVNGECMRVGSRTRAAKRAETGDPHCPRCEEPTPCGIHAR